MSTLHENRVAEVFAADVTEHQMVVVHDEGLYRHLRFQRPNTGLGWFEIVTWPGALAVRGDMDAGFIFSREHDMFQFFRRNGHEHGINPSHWAEKIVGAGRDAAKKYSEDVFRELLDHELKEYEEDYPRWLADFEERRKAFNETPIADRWPMKARGACEPEARLSPNQVRELIQGYDDDGQLGFKEGARALLSELERARVVADTRDWQLNDWSFHYLYACHAIVWAINQYDTLPAK